MSACAPQAWIDMTKTLASYPLSAPDPLPGMSAMGSCAHSISAISPALRIARSGLPKVSTAKCSVLVRAPQRLRAFLGAEAY